MNPNITKKIGSYTNVTPNIVKVIFENIENDVLQTLFSDLLIHSLSNIKDKFIEFRLPINILELDLNFYGEVDSDSNFISEKSFIQLIKDICASSVEEFQVKKFALNDEYSAEFFKNSKTVTVGCQTIEVSKIKQLLELIEE